jgi:hypothetical protein
MVIAHIPCLCFIQETGAHRKTSYLDAPRSPLPVSDPNFLQPDGADPPPAVRLKCCVEWLVHHAKDYKARVQVLWGLKNAYPSGTFRDIVGWLARRMDPAQYAYISEKQPFLGLQGAWGRPPPTSEWDRDL